MRNRTKVQQSKEKVNSQLINFIAPKDKLDEGQKILFDKQLKIANQILIFKQLSGLKIRVPPMINFFRRLGHKDSYYSLIFNQNSFTNVIESNIIEANRKLREAVVLKNHQLAEEIIERYQVDI